MPLSHCVVLRGMTSRAPHVGVGMLHSGALQGDVMVVVAAALYAVSNVTEEALVHAGGTVEVLTC
eukprot:8277229-Pyramimonas_sp.AAC.1